MILQLGNYIKAEVYVTLHIIVECGQLSGQYGGIKTFPENWDSKAPSIGTLLVYVQGV